MKPIFFSLCLFCITNVIGIESAHANDFKIFGYAAQSVVKSDGVNIGGSKDNKLSFDKRDITLFGDKSFNNGFSIRGAIGVTDEPGLDSGQLHVKYLLADKQWRINDDIVGLRLGRVPHTLGFYNSTRNAPHAGQFIYLPEGIYREQFKWLAMSGDGAQTYWNHMFNSDTSIELTGTWTKATLLANREVVAGHFNNPAIGTFDEGKSQVRGITADIRYKHTQFYYNWINLYFWLKPDFPFSTMIPEDRADTNVHVVGVKHYIKNVELTAEFMQVNVYGKVWDSVRATTKHLGHPTGIVLSSVWHVTPKTDIAAYHSQYYTALEDKNGVKQAAATGLPESWFYVRANSIAAKHRINSNWTIRAQYTKGTGIEPFMKSLNPGNGKDWSYAAAQVVYCF